MNPILTHAGQARRSTPTYHRPKGRKCFAAALLLTLVGYLAGPGANMATAQAGRSGGNSAEAKKRAEDAIQVEVNDMVVTPRGMAITLVSDETQQQLHLMIGSLEGQSILRALRHARVPRPQTHDLMKTLLEKDGWQVTRIIIRDLIDDTYYADMVMERPGGFGVPRNVEERTIDARPSDAMALGLRFDATIFVRQKVFDQERERLDEPPSEEKSPESVTI